MKYCYLLFYTLLIIFIFDACNPQLELASQTAENKFVIWCFLHPDSVATALISKTSPILSPNGNRNVKDAVVILYENNIPVDTLKQDSASRYKSVKNFKPTADHIYYLTVSKAGFPTAETLSDTMPRKPKLIKYMVNDSVGIEDINSQTYPARLEFYTDKPSNYPSYSFSSHSYKQYNFFGPPFDAYLPLTRKNNGCVGDWFYLQYRFNDAICGLPVDYYDFTAENGGRPPKLRNLKLGFTIGAATYHPQNFYKKYYYAFNQPTGDVLDDLFFAPTFFPDYVKNGFGFLGCYNTTEIEVQF